MQEAGTELLLASQNVSPELLIDDGFRFRHATVAQAIDALVTR
jgi:NAD dependent epimerase/dehydratase family enzyme